MPTPEEMAQVLGGLPPNPDINEPLAPTEAGAQLTTDFAKQKAQGMADLLMGPGRAMQGEMSPDQMKDWGTQMAMTMAGRGAAPEAGSLGVFGGRLAKTADLQAGLKAAIAENKGATPSDIWHEHGWFRGPEGQWKFEIPDAESRVSSHGLGGVEHLGSNRMANVLQHDPLYEAYPELKNIPVTNQGEPHAGAQHAHPEWGHEQEAIHINPNSIDSSSKQYNPEWIHSAMLHELQHAIQSREGFARGGSQRGQDHVIDPVLVRHGYMKEGPTGLITPTEKMPVGDLMKWRGQFGEGLYKRLAGETEARNVQERLNFHQIYPSVYNKLIDKTPPYQRPPWETQDVSPDKVIVRPMDYSPAGWWKK